MSDPSGKNGDPAFNLWDAGFLASWELDFWGRVQRETEAADATLEVAENDLTVQGALLATQERWVESSTGVSPAMVGFYKALGGGWQSVYLLEGASVSR